MIVSAAEGHWLCVLAIVSLGLFSVSVYLECRRLRLRLNQATKYAQTLFCEREKKEQ